MSAKKSWNGRIYAAEKFDSDGVQARSSLNELGQEVPDPVPMQPPAGLGEPDPLRALIGELTRRQVRSMMDDNPYGIEETEEEANDFACDDDVYPEDIHTPYEAVFDPPEVRGDPKGDEPQPRPPGASKPDVLVSGNGLEKVASAETSVRAVSTEDKQSGQVRTSAPS